ncbi:MAG: SOS response-associated peptidase [Sporolactobacillus sp.]
MCGRFTLTALLADIMHRFEIGKASHIPSYHPAYNIAPGQLVLAIINDGTMNRLGYLRWGLVPHWASDERIGYRLINARAETLEQKPSFRDAFQKRRCLIIADSFYEWRHSATGEKTKQPYRFQLKDNALFAMAGLWESWINPSSALRTYTCTIVTTVANHEVQPFHDRMPVIFAQAEECQWLRRSAMGKDSLAHMLRTTDAPLTVYPVSSAVNTVQNDSPELIKAVRL